LDNFSFDRASDGRRNVMPRWWKLGVVAIALGCRGRDAPVEEEVEEVAENPLIRITPDPAPVIIGVDGGEQELGFARARRVYAPATPYRIQEHEVTWAEYDAWRSTTAMPVWAPTYLAGVRRERYPVVGIPFAEAKAYCDARGLRLPSEAEWELAARGSEMRALSWRSPDALTAADLADPSVLNSFQGGHGRVAPIEMSTRDITPQGIHDMLGNAREWTGDAYRGSTAAEDEQWPDATDGDRFGRRAYRTVKGLPLRELPPDDVAAVTAAYRSPLFAIPCAACPDGLEDMRLDVGFRCAAAP
jgi:formylglycine-generating enzyme required for sulfatase activity